MLSWSIYQIVKCFGGGNFSKFCGLLKHKAIQTFCGNYYFMAISIQLLNFSHKAKFTKLSMVVTLYIPYLSEYGRRLFPINYF